ncbi:UNVERIFIED_CONTAM: hypothetical protein RKD50_001589 [Streptomyces canus]
MQGRDHAVPGHAVVAEAVQGAVRTVHDRAGGGAEVDLELWGGGLGGG